jgi:hypothetical protein
LVFPVPPVIIESKGVQALEIELQMFWEHSAMIAAGTAAEVPVLRDVEDELHVRDPLRLSNKNLFNVKNLRRISDVFTAQRENKTVNLDENTHVEQARRGRVFPCFQGSSTGPKAIQ